MKKGCKTILLLCLLLGLILPIFAGCAPQNTGKRQLWIVTEKSTWSRMNGQIYALKQAYEKEHEDVTIRVEYLPTEEQGRDAYLQQLRTEILQGGGPDLYLLPTDNTLILDEPTQYTYLEVEPLFADVDLAMGNGLFYDLSRLYDADEALDKESLNTAIMDAGLVGDKRYVLPLRYDIPVIYALEDGILDAGLDPSLLEEDILTIMEAVYASGDAVLAAGILHQSFSAFSDFVDYTTGNVLLEEDTLARYMRAYQNLVALAKSDEYYSLAKLDVNTYINEKYDQTVMWVESEDDIQYINGEIIYTNAKEKLYTYYRLWLGNMQDAFAYGPAAQHAGWDMAVKPVKGVGGQSVATVTYYGAIGAGCEDAELAYDFLRQFLLEESQWEYNRPTKSYEKPMKGQAEPAYKLQYAGLIEEGWAVRDVNSLNALWKIRRKQIQIKPAYMETTSAKNRMRAISSMELKEEYAPILNVEIGEVRFNTGLSDTFAEALSSLNDEKTGAPTDADIPALAEELLWNLRWFVAEG